MGWCASIRWAQAWPRYRGIGSRCSASWRDISFSRSPAPTFAAGGLLMPPRRRQRVRILAIVLILAGLLGGIGALALRPTPPPPIVGMVRTTEVEIGPEVS